MPTIQERVKDINRRKAETKDWKKRTEALLEAGIFKTLHEFCRSVPIGQTHYKRILAKEFPPSDPTIRKVEAAFKKAAK